MKQLFYIVIALSPMLLFSQKSSIGLSGGYTTNGFGGIAEYNHYFAQSSSINASVYYSFASSEEGTLKSDYSDLTINVGYYHKAYDSGSFNIYLGGGGTIGYEVINNGNNNLDNGIGIKSESQVIYGGYVGANMNYFISDYFALSLVTNEFYHVNSDLGNFAFYGGLGIKYFVF